MSKHNEICPQCKVYKELLGKAFKKLQMLDKYLRANDLYKASAWNEIPVSEIISDEEWHEEWSR